MRMLSFISKIVSMYRMPTTSIYLFGSQAARERYKEFTSRHPRYPFFQFKKWGVALIEIPTSFEIFIKGKPKETLRNNRNRAIAKGYSVRLFDPRENVDAILKINASSPQRQGRAMDAHYLSQREFLAYVKDHQTWYGVFDRGDNLKAYTATETHGELVIFSLLLGHADVLTDNVMYLLISDVIAVLTKKRAAEGNPCWAMYDTFLGASSGLQYFKMRLGFSPYRVNWRWREHA